MSAAFSHAVIRLSSTFALGVLAALTLAVQTAEAGKPVFQRSKPHVNVGSASPRVIVSPAPLASGRAAKIEAFTWKQTVRPASQPEFKYLPVRRYANEVAVESLKLAAEGRPVQPSAAGPGQIRFGEGLHGRTSPAAPGGHVKVFSGVLVVPQHRWISKQAMP